MTLSPWWKIGGGVLAVVFVTLFAVTWLREHDARTKADATNAAQQAVIESAQKTIDAAKADAAKTASDLQTRLAAIEEEKKQPVTAPQFVADLNKVIPNLPQPATVVSPASTSSSEKPAGGGDQAAAGGVLIPAADLQALKNYKLDCDATGAQLSACQRVSADQTAELDAQKSQLAAVTKQRDAYKTAVKGGSLLHRVTKQLKCLAISGGASALGAWADKNQPARGAAIGAAAGGIGCQVVF